MLKPKEERVFESERKCGSENERTYNRSKISPKQEGKVLFLIVDCQGRGKKAFIESTRGDACSM